jgi:hypothetical protein
MPHPLLWWMLLTGALVVGPAAQAQNRGARASMEQCVERVLTRLARAKASEKEVGPAIISGCDGPLRAAVADAIKSGEAAICANVDSCMNTARQRAADEAKLSYRERFRR